MLRKENGRYFFFFFVAFLTAFLTAFLIFFLAAMRNLLRCYYDPDRRARSHPRDLTEDCPSLHEDIQVRLELVQCVAEMFVACGQSTRGMADQEKSRRIARDNDASAKIVVECRDAVPFRPREGITATDPMVGWILDVQVRSRMDA